MQKEKSIKIKLQIAEWKALHDYLVDAYAFILKESRHLDDMVTVLCLEEIMIRFQKKFIDWEHQGLLNNAERQIKFSWIDYIAVIKGNCVDGDPFAENVMHKLVLKMPPEISALLR